MLVLNMLRAKIDVQKSASHSSITNAGCLPEDLDASSVQIFQSPEIITKTIINNFQYKIV